MTTTLPPDLRAYERQLVDAIGREVAERRSRHRRMQAGAAAGAAAAAAAVTVVVLTASSGPLSPPPAAAAIIRGVERAVTPAPGQILHVAMTETDSQPSAGTDTRQVWLLPVPAGRRCDLPACPAQDVRISYTSSQDSRRVDSSTDGHGLTDLYDSASNTVYEPTSAAASWQPPQPLDGQSVSPIDPLAPGFAPALQRLIAGGRAHVVGDTTLGGRTVVQIAGSDVACGPTGSEPSILPSAPSTPGRQCVVLSSWTYDVEPGSYIPVQIQTTTHDSVDGTWTDTLSFQTYQELPAAGNMSVFDLADQHPGARVADGAAAYRAEAAQVDSVERLSPLQTSLATP